MNFSRKTLSALGLFALLTLASSALAQSPAAHQPNKTNSIQHVLLISIDGMHALDFINCSNGIVGANGGEPFCPNLTSLSPTGVNYLVTQTSEPSDSFPGLTALVSGSSPRSAGAFYDVAYDRSLAPPAQTTGNGLAAGPCVTGSGKKLAEHGGFSHDDTNVILLLSNPSLPPATVTTPVQTMEIALTILKALGLNPNALDSVQIEGTAVLPRSY
ncbi:MAG: alkaline phosphatase family protein [Candidatus Sulfotelmatobacter sp.]